MAIECITEVTVKWTRKRENIFSFQGSKLSHLFIYNIKRKTSGIDLQFFKKCHLKILGDVPVQGNSGGQNIKTFWRKVLLSDFPTEMLWNLLGTILQNYRDVLPNFHLALTDCFWCFYFPCYWVKHRIVYQSSN